MTLMHQNLAARSGQTRSLVVLLHGFGANGSAMLGLGRSLSVALQDAAFVAPDAPDAVPGRTGGRMWYPIPEVDDSSPEEADRRLQASARLLDAYLDAQLAAHGLTASALALVGFSQGAGLAYEIGPRRGDQLAGVVAISGRMKRKDRLVTEARTKPPFLILSGVQDRVLTGDEFTQTATALSDAGIPATRLFMRGTGHGISDEGVVAARDFLARALSRAS